MRMNVKSLVSYSLFSLSSLCLMILSGCSSMGAWTSNRVGKAYYESGNYAMARQEFHRAIAENPTNPNFYHNMASAMHKQGDLGGAEKAYREALTVDPSHQPSYHGLAQLMHEQSRTADAHQLMQTWVATQPNNPSAHVEMAWLQKETGDLNGAEVSLKQALRARPNHPIATAQLAQVYESRGDNRSAIALYKKSLYSNWNQPEVQKRLAALKKNNNPYGDPNQLATTSAWNGTPQFSTAQGYMPQPYPNQTVMAPPVNGQVIWSNPEGMPIENVDPAHMQPVQQAEVDENGQPL